MGDMSDVYGSEAYRRGDDDSDYDPLEGQSLDGAVDDILNEK